MTYLIAEIGQNHNGSIDLAKLLIDIVARPITDKFNNKQFKGMDAVKFTKRDLKQELSKSQMDRIYNSPNSFGKTYGEHREYLELSDIEHFELFNYAKSKNLDFIETICGIGGLSLLKLFKPDKLKVASRDLTNLPLIKALAENKIPMILSTGMSGIKEIDNAINIISNYHEKISILHCLSEYPASYKNINLKSIVFLKKKYPRYTIGYSDHSIGISIPNAAVAIGAEIIEKHVTLDRNMKGTDQIGSLSIPGIEKMVRDIRNLEDALGEEKVIISDSVKENKLKLERSIASKVKILKGQVLKESDLQLLSPGDGFKWSDLKKIIGKKVKIDIDKDEIIYRKFLE
ncbi:MAG: shikimate dehydrogenase [Flavobacteriaceae bacterium]|nr:shikimate dehydrogenase [Flavobacteriaceae bacterium]|tara:strand:- start:521 stop:1555 length:1035 start_codon:yes stop_codon:yes gene_type:complete